MPAAKKKTSQDKLRRKKAPAKKAPAKPRKPRADEDLHPRKLKGKLLLELRASALELELKRSKLATVNAKLGALSMQAEHAPVFVCLNEKDVLVAEMKESTVSFANVQKKIAEKFGIALEDLHKYEFDTDSGAVTLLG